MEPRISFTVTHVKRYYRVTRITRERRERLENDGSERERGGDIYDTYTAADRALKGDAYKLDTVKGRRLFI